MRRRQGRSLLRHRWLTEGAEVSEVAEKVWPAFGRDRFRQHFLLIAAGRQAVAALLVKKAGDGERTLCFHSSRV
jgi:hypothetical protein